MSQQLFEIFEPISSSSNLRNIFEEMKENLLSRVKTINTRIAADLGLLYIFQQLENESDKEELLKFWRLNSPHQVIQLPMGEFHYRPYVDFISLDKIMNGLYIDNVLEQLLKFDNLSFYESCAILSDLERYYIVPLSEMDVKIIEAVKDIIKETTFFNNDILSKKLNVRSNYISRRMGYLRNNAYFRVTGTVNFPKIGLRQYLILIESSLKCRDKIPQYFASPFTRTIRRCPNQRFDYIVSLTLPKHLEKSLFEYLAKLSDNKIVRCFYCDEVSSISNNLDFSYYSYSKRPTVMSTTKPGFYIDWFKERILTMETNQSENSFHRFKFDGNKTNLSLTDLKVLTLFRRDLDSSVRTIAKRISLTWDEANEHMNRVKDLFFPMILLYYTGLNQSALLFFEDITPKQLNSLEKILARMPQVFTYSFRNGGAIVTVDLMNGAHRLNDLICETMPELKSTQFSLASKTSGIFRSIPYKFYNEANGSWFFPEDFFLSRDIE
ncbi:MAG: hypothetical protein ACTSQK_01045 [Candidatus Heimdallarchaeota archaeon]